jgi:hypothetical protein
MASNTLTGLIPTFYEAIDVVSRELVGFIPAVTSNHTAERAALNQSILVPITQALSLTDNTAAVTAPATAQTITSMPLSITKSKNANFVWNGEDTRGMLNAGTYHGVFRQNVEQAIRALVNQIENDTWVAAYTSASRATGTAGTAPFGTAGDISAAAKARAILDANGVPQSDLHLVLGSAAVQNLRGVQTILIKANENGSDDFRRTGKISDVPLVGFDLHNSGQIAALTAGTGASYVTSGSTAIGTDTVALVTGTGTVLAGDAITFAADTVNTYIANVGVAAPGTITFGGAPGPGALKTIATANALTIGAAYTPNMAFHRSAIQLITRLPAMPVDPSGKAMDMADDSVIVTDPISGISFEFAVYKQYHQISYAVRLAWGVAATKGNFIATVMG